MKNEELIKQTEFSTLLYDDVLQNISSFLDSISIISLASTSKRFRSFFNENIQTYKRALTYKNYALAQGLFSKPQFKIEQAEQHFLSYVKHLRDPVLREITTAIANNDTKQFAVLCRKHFDVLEQEDLITTSILFLVHVLRNQDCQKIVWVEFCLKFSINDSKLDKHSFDIPLLCRAIFFSLYCDQFQHLRFLLKKLIVEIYKHRYEHLEFRFYSLFLRYLDMAIKLRSYKAIQIIHEEYFSKTKVSLLKADQYLSAIQNIDFELIFVLIAIESKRTQDLENIKIGRLTVDDFTNILQKTFHLAASQYQFYFLAKLYKHMLHVMPKPSRHLHIDLKDFLGFITPRVIISMEPLFNFFVENKDEINFENVDLFFDALLKISTSTALNTILKLSSIFDFQGYFEQKDPRSLFDDMNQMYLRYQQTSTLEVYFSFAKKIKETYQLPSFLDYLNTHLTDILSPSNTRAQRARNSFLMQKQKLLEKTDTDEKTNVLLKNK